MGTKADIAYHEYLDDLCEREVYAKVVLKIEHGIIKEVIESYVHKPGEILRKYDRVEKPADGSKPHKRRVIMIKQKKSGA